MEAGCSAHSWTVFKQEGTNILDPVLNPICISAVCLPFPDCVHLAGCLYKLQCSQYSPVVGLIQRENPVAVLTHTNAISCPFLAHVCHRRFVFQAECDCWEKLLFLESCKIALIISANKSANHFFTWKIFTSLGAFLYHNLYLYLSLNNLVNAMRESNAIILLYKYSSIRFPPFPFMNRVAFFWKPKG